MKFYLDQFVTLVRFLNNSPVNLPKRMEKIKSIFVQRSSDAEIIIDIENFDKEKVLDISELSDKDLNEILKCINKRIDSGEFGLNLDPLESYLLTKAKRCCGKALKCKWPDGGKVPLYTASGIVSAQSFTLNCQTCHKRYFPAYTDVPIDSDRYRREYVKFDEIEYFHVTKDSYFSLDFLRNLNYDIVITHCEFTSFCDSYNAKFSDDNSRDLNKKRVIDVWLVYSLAKRMPLRFIVPRYSWGGIDTEEVCDLHYVCLKESVDNRWLPHKCTSIGCLRRIVIGDGDQKLFRTRCNAVADQIISKDGEICLIPACPQNPLPGEISCATHMDGKRGPLEVEQPDIRRITRSMAPDFGFETEEISIESAGCRPKENISTTGENRTVTDGMDYYFRDCHLRLGHSEMLTCESCTIIVLSMIDIFGLHPPKTIISGLGFDRACEICPFIKNKEAKGNTALATWSSMDMVVPLFHIGGHKRPECTLDSPECKYHPQHESNIDLFGGCNLEVAEQSFKQLNKSKLTTRYMSRARRLVFFKVIDDEFNMILETRQRKNGTLITAGSDISYEEARKRAVENLDHSGYESVLPHETVDVNQETIVDHSRLTQDRVQPDDNQVTIVDHSRLTQEGGQVEPSSMDNQDSRLTWTQEPVVMNQFENQSSSPTCLDLSISQWPGQFLFDVAFTQLSLNTKNKRVDYSERLKKLFIEMNRLVETEFRVGAELPEGMYIRAMPIYADSSHVRPVVRCTNHASLNDPTNENFAFPKHLIRVQDDNAIYDKDVNSGCLSVFFPVGAPDQGLDKCSRLLKFMCFSSDIGGIKNKSVKVIFSLEAGPGVVVGRKVVDVRICYSPKRDMQLEEEKVERQEEEATSVARRLDERVTSSHIIMGPPPKKKVKKGEEIIMVPSNENRNHGNEVNLLMADDIEGQHQSNAFNLVDQQNEIMASDTSSIEDEKLECSLCDYESNSVEDHMKHLENHLSR